MEIVQNEYKFLKIFHFMWYTDVPTEVYSILGQNVKSIEAITYAFCLSLY